jgi:molecular chaperone GrpE
MFLAMMKSNASQPVNHDSAHDHEASDYSNQASNSASAAHPASSLEKGVDADAAAGTPQEGNSAQAELEKRLQELEKTNQKLEAQLKEKESKYTYLYADLENFKKRMIKERSDLLKFGWESLARDLLHTLDNLERALQYVPSDMDQNFITGIQMVLGELQNTLNRQGVQHIESVEKDFDPHLHEAVGQEISDLPSGRILREQSRGYTLHGRLLRPAKVVISQGQSSGEN